VVGLAQQGKGEYLKPRASGSQASLGGWNYPVRESRLSLAVLDLASAVLCCGHRHALLAEPRVFAPAQDSLEVGNGRHGRKLTPAQTLAHFALYSVTSSPLILGNDVRNMSADDMSAVSNRDAIMVNQAWAGLAGDMLHYSQFSPVNASRRRVCRLWPRPRPATFGACGRMARRTRVCSAVASQPR
jgi:hypothetical protein